MSSAKRTSKSCSSIHPKKKKTYEDYDDTSLDEISQLMNRQSTPVKSKSVQNSNLQQKRSTVMQQIRPHTARVEKTGKSDLKQKKSNGAQQGESLNKKQTHTAVTKVDKNGDKHQVKLYPSNKKKLDTVNILAKGKKLESENLKNEVIEIKSQQKKIIEMLTLVLENNQKNELVVENSSAKTIELYPQSSTLIDQVILENAKNSKSANTFALSVLPGICLVEDVYRTSLSGSSARVPEEMKKNYAKTKKLDTFVRSEIEIACRFWKKDSYSKQGLSVSLSNHLIKMNSLFEKLKRGDAFTKQLLSNENITPVHLQFADMPSYVKDRSKFEKLDSCFETDEELYDLSMKILGRKSNSDQNESEIDLDEFKNDDLSEHEGDTRESRTKNPNLMEGESESEIEDENEDEINNETESESELENANRYGHESLESSSESVFDDDSEI